MTPQTSSIPLDTLFETLSNPRRRYLLHHLLDHPNGVAEFDTVSGLIARWEQRTGRSNASSEDVAIDLHHTHLPRLADVGLVEYDRRSGALRYRDRVPVRDCFERTRMDDLPELDSSK